MPHHPKPWFRPARNTWYVQVDGTQTNLGADRGRPFATYRALMAGRKAPPPRSDSVAALLDRFLEWVQGHRSPDTYRWYKDRLQAFLDHLPRGLSVGRL